MDTKDPGQANLRFVLPLRRGQQVAILGDAPSLARTMASENINPVMVLPEQGRYDLAEYGEWAYYRASACSQPLPLKTASADHVLIPRLTQDQAGWLPEEVARILKPDGWLFCGVERLAALRSLRFWNGACSSFKHNVRLELLLGPYRKFLGQHNLIVSDYYGIWHSLHQPKYLIPLGRPGPVRYFFEQMYTPYSNSAALLQRFAQLMTRVGLQRLLFNNIGIVARLSPGWEV